MPPEGAPALVVLIVAEPRILSAARAEAADLNAMVAAPNEEHGDDGDPEPSGERAWRRGHTAAHVIENFDKANEAESDQQDRPVVGQKVSRRGMSCQTLFTRNKTPTATRSSGPVME